MYHGSTMNTQRDRALERVRRVPLVGLFFEWSFVHYAWTGVFISVLNVALLWLFIDVMHFATVLASIIVVGGTFFLRYLLFKLLNLV